ncbi:VOC family protein [Acidimicrobiia bacterium EGI L10123]|uniref:VOC family protein n=1 Tax=Salinilacustrithrix flava TaxID=2957203 RepID=UPI003D7C33D3|nr:VOC family protein [Acidimicrobiia bacterium EGI L10123]
MAFHPYLNFKGTCREAFTRYQEIFGGDLHIMGAGDMPAGEDTPPGWDPDMVLHAALMVGDAMIMASDDPDMSSPPSGTYIHHEAADVDAAKRAFEALAEGGQVEMDFGETFWSPGFGACADRWGTLWMVSAPSSFEMPG